MKILDITTLFAIVTPLTGCGRGARNRRLLRGPSPRLDAAARLRRRQAHDAERDTVTPILCASDPTEGDEGLASLSQRSNRTYFGPGGEDQLLAVVGDRSVALMHQIIPRRLQ